MSLEEFTEHMLEESITKVVGKVVNGTQVQGAACHELRNYARNYVQGNFVTIDDIGEKFARTCCI